MAHDMPLQALVGVRPRNYLHADGSPRVESHAPAHEVRKLVGTSVWDGFHSIAIARNPWDRVVSQYFFRHRKAETSSAGFREFVRSRRFTVEANMYCASGEQVQCAEMA